MISVPADIAGQSKHVADWLDGRKAQGPSPVLARAKRQLEELEVDWADAFAVPEPESVTVPRPKKKRTEEPAATSHLPPAISASHTAKPPHPPGKVLAQKTADQQLMAQAAHRVQRQAEQAKKKEDEAKKKKKEEDEKRKKKGKDEEEKRKKKEREKKEKEEEEKRRTKAEEEKAEKVVQRALSSSLHVLCISSRVLCSVLRVLCLCYASALLFPGKQDGTAAGTRRAPQDQVAVIIPKDQWSPSQQGGEEEEEDDWSEFMPGCQVFSAKSKAYEELGKWQLWWETYEADEIEDLCPDPKTMRMSPSKPPTPKKKKPQGDPPAQPPALPQGDKGPAEAAAPAEAPAAAAQEEEATAPAAAAAQEDDAPAPPQEEEAPAATPQEGEGAAPKEEEAPEGATPEGDPSPQEQGVAAPAATGAEDHKEGDAAPAATGAEDHRPEWEKEWEAEVVVQTIQDVTE